MMKRVDTGGIGERISIWLDTAIFTRDSEGG